MIPFYKKSYSNVINKIPKDKRRVISYLVDNQE